MRVGPVVAADVVVRSRLAQLGTGVVKATAHEPVREFSACVDAALAAAAPVEPAVGPAAPFRVLPLAGRLLLALLSGLLQQAAAWKRPARTAVRNGRGA